MDLAPPMAVAWSKKKNPPKNDRICYDRCAPSVGNLNLSHPRRHTRSIHLGPVAIGGGAPISIQSMTTTLTEDAINTLAQIDDLAAAGCDMVRVAVPHIQAIAGLNQCVRKSPLPVIADVHFDEVLALAALGAGVHGLRINPGNLGRKSGLDQVLCEARDRNVVTRIGINGGSLEKGMLRKHGGKLAQAMVASAREALNRCEQLHVSEVKLSLKASNVRVMVDAYRLAVEEFHCPLHLGLTEAGTPWSGTIRSAAAIGSLLLDGIGDTIRVSLAGSPVHEVRVARELLVSLGLRAGAVLLACPSCGRAHGDVAQIASRLEAKLGHWGRKDLVLAVMACEVNGPGEAKNADLGLALGPRDAVIFKHGEMLRRVPYAEAEAAVEVELARMARLDASHA